MPAQLTPMENQLLATRICDLGLANPGSRVEAGITALQRELTQVGIVRCHPHFYLSTEWGVPGDSVSIAIPFYLSRADLVALHAKLTGYVEGAGHGDLLRYLRHEMGHVVLYAYRLFERPAWQATFGAFDAAYPEAYRPEPFCARFVRHLPGWYAQKHPEEDWAETFAVWMTPDLDWRSTYRDWPLALAKLEYCDRLLKEVSPTVPLLTTINPDEDASQLTMTLDVYYRALGVGSPVSADHFPPGLDAALQAIFEDVGDREDLSSSAARLPAAQLIRALALPLVGNAFRWTGHFPENVEALVDHLANRAESLQAAYPADREVEVVVALTTLVASLAMNHVLRGQYLVT